MSPREDAAFWEGFRQGFITALATSAVGFLAVIVLWWAVLS